MKHHMPIRKAATALCGSYLVLLMHACFVPNDEFDLVADLHGDAGGCRATLAGRSLAPRGDSVLPWGKRATPTTMLGVTTLGFDCSSSGRRQGTPVDMGYRLSIDIPVDSAGLAHAKKYQVAGAPDPRSGLNLATVTVSDAGFTDSMARAVHNMGTLFLTVVSGTLDVTEVQQGGLVGHLAAKVRLKQHY